MAMKYEGIFNDLKAAANPEKAVQMSAYMRNLFPFLGVATPERKKLSKGFLSELSREEPDWDFVNECWAKREREYQYLAMDYLSKIRTKLTPDDIPKIQAIAVKKSWWDSIDGLDTVIGDIVLRNPKANKIMFKWSTDENFWLRRIAIDHQLGRKEKTDTELLARIIKNNFGQTEFFINKAIGWSLREYSKTDPAWVRAFIEKHRDELAPLSIREGSKYV